MPGRRLLAAHWPLVLLGSGAEVRAAGTDTVPWPALFGLLLIVAALAAAAAAAWAQRLAARRVYEAQRDTQLLRQLMPACCWQTDATHRLQRFDAGTTTAAPASADAWRAHRPWDLLRAVDDADDAWRQRLERGAALSDLHVRLRDGAIDTRWRLDAVPRLDAEGRFDGHVGTLLPLHDDRALRGDAAADDGVAAEQQSISYAVSHDLRAPIRVVEGFTRILKEDYGRQLDRIGNDHLDRVLGAAARMNQMIDALLGLARLSSQPLLRQSVDLSQLAGFVVDDLRRQSPQPPADVVIEPGLSAHGDPTLLRMVLENLLGNAWKYSARCERRRIRFERTQVDGRETFVVRDNGAGFDMRFADRLFGAFQRLHSASDFQGTGIGLASVKRIVARHGGRIWADGEVGKGANFYFTLG